MVNRAGWSARNAAERTRHLCGEPRSSTNPVINLNYGSIAEFVDRASFLSAAPAAYPRGELLVPKKLSPNLARLQKPRIPMPSFVVHSTSTQPALWLTLPVTPLLTPV